MRKGNDGDREGQRKKSTRVREKRGKKEFRIEWEGFF